MLKIFIKYGFAAILLFIVLIPSVEAHPLDITGSEFFVSTGESIVQARTYIHPYLLGLLFDSKKIAYEKPADFYNHKKVLVDYLNEKISLKNNGQLCRIVSVNLPPLDDFEILGGGFAMEYQLDCGATISRLEYENKLFIEFSKLQTNKMVFYSDGEMQTFQIGDEEYMEDILTAKIMRGYYDFQGENKRILQDLDQDGLSDEQEAVYGTDPTEPDSDYDGYTDKEETDNGWDPLVADLSPGQKKREYQGDRSPEREIIDLPEEIASEADNVFLPLEELSDDPSAEIETQSEQTGEIIITSQANEETGDSARFFQTERLQKYLDKLKTLFERDDVTAKILIFALIYVLGVLHALESGHGKGILISYLVEHDKGRKEAFLFSTVMTVTHLADVIILALVFKVLSISGDVYKYIGGLQKLGAYILLFLGLFYLVKNFLPHDEFKRESSAGKASVLAFIAGLAPCTIGWAIMIILFSIGKISWIIPVILVFGLGIWTTLLVFGFVIVEAKRRFFSKLKYFSRISATLSALLLITVALILLI